MMSVAQAIDVASHDVGGAIACAPRGTPRLRWTSTTIVIECGAETLVVANRGAPDADGACAHAAAILAAEVLRARPWLLQGPA